MHSGLRMLERRSCPERHKAFLRPHRALGDIESHSALGLTSRYMKRG